MPMIGTLPECDPENNTLSAFMESVHLFMETDEVTEGKQRTILGVIGTNTYALLHNLVSPAQSNLTRSQVQQVNSQVHM